VRNGLTAGWRMDVLAFIRGRIIVVDDWEVYAKTEEFLY
jgi:hypothetical protein